ncbi:MAG: hypothetical protein IPK16_22840 [Anaerolineales bacterium]|nr:hypothetical protein [Anaerolineales bacterium]
MPPQSVNVTFNGVALQQLTITQPMQGQTVSPTFDVIGTGTNLPGNQVTVQVLNGTGSVQQTVLATVQNIQPNGQGTWQVRFINVNPGDPYFGQVRASAAAGSTAPPAIVPVIINGPGQ